MKGIQFYSILLIIFLLFGECTNNSPNGKNQTKANKGSDENPTHQVENLNVSIFLDLSDRISPTRNPNDAMQYWKRDIGDIQSITNAFEYHLKNKKIIVMNDHIQLYFLPLPKDIPNINDIVSKLNMNFTKDNVTKDYVNSVSSEYQKYATIIYNKTLEEREPDAKRGIDTYPGSDLFGFFKSNVKDFCIKKNYRNVLFILTDGYVYFKGRSPSKDADNESNFLLSKSLKQWGFTVNNYEGKLEKEGYGFQVPTKGLSNLEVYVIGLEPSQSWELDVLHWYWKDWLKNMGVKNFQEDNSERYLKQAALPANLNESIQNFLNK